VEAVRCNERLNIDLVAKSGERTHIAARAAAISATHLLVQKAALELDVAPDEFEALEPRLRHDRPVLQIADTLINGSGLCRRLCQPGADGRPDIARLIDEILTARDEWPLTDFMDAKHEAQCSTSCYMCIQQYQNRRYHPLLDWRLGLAYLRSITNPAFQCGLDGDFESYPDGSEKRKCWRMRSLRCARSFGARSGPEPFGCRAWSRSTDSSVSSGGSS
jgi:hypothetical protein